MSKEELKHLIKRVCSMNSRTGYVYGGLKASKMREINI